MATMKTFFVLATVFWVCGTSWASEDDNPSIVFPEGVVNQVSDRPWCTVDQLLPRELPEGVGASPEWSTYEVDHPYGCDCSFFRARYYCPSDENTGYREWIPRSISERTCRSVSHSDLIRGPLPPDFKVLIYGNSHIRQVIEGMMCMFKDRVVTKRVRYYLQAMYGRETDEPTVSGDTVCRGCGRLDRDVLVDHGCMDEKLSTDGCLCTDNTAEFHFDNGAVLHYHMAGTEENKSLSDSLGSHGNVTWSWYDAVFANRGNNPPLSTESVLKAAVELQEASVPFFWMNQYSGVGDLGDWDDEQRLRFRSSGAKHVKIDSMTRGMKDLTKGSIEDTEDPHFCLPGPPDEMAVLLIRMMWALVV